MADTNKTGAAAGAAPANGAADADITCSPFLTGIRAVLGERTPGNMALWALTAVLMLALIKESVAPTWTVAWSHPSWGTVNVVPVLGIGVGMVAGFLGGMVGAFISLFSVPLYTLWLGLPVKVALGTNSLASAVIGLMAAMVHLSKKTPNMKVAFPMMATGFLGAGAGAYISLGMTPEQLKMYFSVLVFGAAFWMLWRGIRPAPAKSGGFVATEKQGPLYAGGEWNGVSYRTNILYPAFGNFFIAALTGIIGVGGGFLFTPMLHAAFGLPMMVAVGTGNFVKVANIGSQFIVRGVADTVIYQLAVFAMLGGYCGANFGRRLGCVVDTRYLRLLFGILLIFVGLQYMGIKLGLGSA
ncbi:MAG: sulfite exporter TauE/SafE family protein [Desulfovibrio sp.]|jgi:uncharacterized membrane protein YfcA|nr:sulfite exporter TauE/SafE family protein [Desulfovibrio sp.]